ncbi:hypothetical protein STCU_11672 [Strigomonas culicis]|uniref:Uncharacterized protein n=1 Tax=Strigomonas culicis TaxID=28005 RepID=S9THV5_9TRYP|nr:hypothetical protein STCU_11672 [Strigomonas culicis]|eukprot:EPY15923.1 hypothetical protein STCU_11672 [Strigomonas culicis]
MGLRRRPVGETRNAAASVVAKESAVAAPTALSRGHATRDGSSAVRSAERQLMSPSLHETSATAEEGGLGALAVL